MRHALSIAWSWLVPRNCLKKVTLHHKERYRKRVGRYRIIFTPDHDNRVVGGVRYLAERRENVSVEKEHLFVAARQSLASGSPTAQPAHAQ